MSGASDANLATAWWQRFAQYSYQINHPETDSVQNEYDKKLARRIIEVVKQFFSSAVHGILFIFWERYRNYYNSLIPSPQQETDLEGARRKSRVSIISEKSSSCDSSKEAPESSEELSSNTETDSEELIPDEVITVIDSIPQQVFGQDNSKTVLPQPPRLEQPESPLGTASQPLLFDDSLQLENDEMPPVSALEISDEELEETEIREEKALLSSKSRCFEENGEKEALMSEEDQLSPLPPLVGESLNPADLSIENPPSLEKSPSNTTLEAPTSKKPLLPPVPESLRPRIDKFLEKLVSMSTNRWLITGNSLQLGYQLYGIYSEMEAVGNTSNEQYMACAWYFCKSALAMDEKHRRALASNLEQLYIHWKGKMGSQWDFDRALCHSFWGLYEFRALLNDHMTKCPLYADAGITFQEVARLMRDGLEEYRAWEDLFRCSYPPCSLLSSERLLTKQVFFSFKHKVELNPESEFLSSPLDVETVIEEGRINFQNHIASLEELIEEEADDLELCEILRRDREEDTQRFQELVKNLRENKEKSRGVDSFFKASRLLLGIREKEDS